MKIIWSTLLAVSLTLAAFNVKAQTNPPIITGPGTEIIKFLSSGTNWMISTYGIYDTGTKRGGGGIAVLKDVTDYIAVGIRVDYLNKNFWMPQADFQLQAPFQLFGKVTVIPFAFTGIATPLGGRGSENHTPIGIVGIGAAIRIYKGLDAVTSYEKWNTMDGNQIRLGVLYKF